MARTQAADYPQRRKEILDQAAALFAARGFHGSSVSDLAAACGMTKSLVYHYYSSKEDILFDVMDSHLGALEEAAKSTELEALTPPGRLKVLSRTFMRHYAGAVAQHKVLLNELDRLPPPRRKQIIERQRRIIDSVQSILLEIVPSLEQDPRFARPATMLYFGMINWTHTWLRLPGPTSSDEIADMATDIILGGLASADRQGK